MSSLSGLTDGLSAADLVRLLGLRPHPEGGHYVETFRSLTRVTPAGATRPDQVRAGSTAIYYLLAAGGLSALHRVTADEVWHHYAGDPLELHTIDPSGLHSTARLGRDLVAGERPQAVVPAGVWQAALPVGAAWSLVGCTVAPGFDFRDFELPERDELVERFPLLRDVIVRLTHDQPVRDTIKIALD